MSVTSQKGHKVVQNHKKLIISLDFFCIELKVSTVVMLLTKFHDMSTVTFPWQHNGLQGPLHSKGKIRVFLLQEVLFALVVHSVGVSEHGHYKAEAQGSLLNSRATNKAVFILGR